MHELPTSLLSGVLHCGVCGSRMTHEVARSDGGKRSYTFYKCGSHGRSGSRACPGSRASTGDLDQFVLDRIHDIGNDPTVLALDYSSGAVARARSCCDTRVARKRGRRRRIRQYVEATE